MKQLQGINIYLIGMMGVGKSTVGKELARKLDYRFFDTDTLIEQAAPKVFTEELDTQDRETSIITQMFAKLGEAKFRDFETQILAEVSQCNKSAIATGGGIVEKRQNWSYLQYGLVIWLDAPEALIKERLSQDGQNDNRPLLAQISSRLELRRPLYAQADLHVPIEKEQTPTAIVEQIVVMIPSILKAKPALCN
jgi:shikimate kinase